MINDTANHVHFDIGRILPTPSKTVSSEDLIHNISIKQYLEKAEEFNQLNFASTGNLIEDISQVLKVDNNNLKGIGFACISSIHSYNGNYKKAIEGFNKALSLNVCDEVSAYILTEYANLLRQLQRKDEAMAIFDKALQLAGNTKLKWRILFLQGICYKQSDKSHALHLLNQAANFYLETKIYSRYAAVLRNIGTLYCDNGEFKRAKHFLKKAEQIAKRYSFHNILFSIQNDSGWIFLQKKKYKMAREIFLDLLSKDLIPYVRATATQNLAFLEFESKNYRKAIHYHKESLQITLKYEMFEMLIEDYYRLGLAHERIGEYNQADKYYSVGYNHLLEERKNLGIVLLAGYRGVLLDNYVRFLSERPSLQHAREHEKTFEFTNDKTYSEILGIFQKELLLLHRYKHRTIVELCEALAISQKLFFIYQKRLGLIKPNTKGSKNINHHFQNYIYSLISQDWRSAKNKFDQDLYSYLLKKHNFNKTKIAKLLDVSILTVINKTAELSV